MTTFEELDAYQKAQTLFDREEYEEAFRYYLEAARQGNPQAQCKLADCYYYGYGVSKDRGEAAAWYRKAAQQGNGKAIQLLHYKPSKPRPPRAARK